MLVVDLLHKFELGVWRIKLINNPGAGVATLPYLTTRLLGKVRPKKAMPGPAVTPYYVTTVTAESMIPSTLT